jgi:hypothetical protein
MIELTNANVVNMQLAAIPEAIRKAVEADAMKRTNKLVADRLKSTVPVNTGALKKSIGSVVRKYKNGSVVLGVIGPRMEDRFVRQTKLTKRGKKKVKLIRVGEDVEAMIRPFRYAHLPDAGTKARITKSGVNRGAVQAIRFMERTYEISEQEIVDIFAAAVKKAAEGN